MISIRRATDSDAQAIARLVNAAFLVERFFIERDRTDAAEISSLMKRGQFLLAEDGTNLSGDRGYFGMLSIDPARQRTGIGRQLIDAVEKYFRDSGCKFCDLKIVNVRTELHSLYQGLGYIDDGIAVYDDPAPTKIPVHFIHMCKPLL
jgi:GNAT superfamily N-acetyltransferase